MPSGLSSKSPEDASSAAASGTSSAISSNELVSASLSLASTLNTGLPDMPICMLFDSRFEAAPTTTVTVSSRATGASFTGVTSIVTAAVPVESPLLTVYANPSAWSSPPSCV